MTAWWGLRRLPAKSRNASAARVREGFGFGSLMAAGRLFAPLMMRRYANAGRGARAASPLSLYTCIVMVVLVVPVLSVIPYAFTSSDYIAFPPKLFSTKWFGTFIDSPVG